MIQLGEAREALASDVWNQIEDFANHMKSEDRPFYIVYAAKPDHLRQGVFRAAIKAYYRRPEPMLGILVWYVDNANGIFQFVPELSAPPDIPLDPSLLSTKSDDQFGRVAEQGKRLHALIS